MKTEVIMKRELFEAEISQSSKSEFFSATDLVRAGNKWRRARNLSDFNISSWFNKQSTIEFIKELEDKYGVCFQKGRGRTKHTWVHPLLFIDMALAISPKLKIEVYEWLFDHLIKKRNLSGDSYKEMCGRMYPRQINKRDFPKFISGVAQQIKNRCKVDDWQKATEEQLTLRDRIHYDIALLADVMNNNQEAVRIALTRSMP